VTPGRSRNTALIAFFAIATLLVVVRFLCIDTRSLHSDEAVQWYFYFDKIVRGEMVLFRPEYHGLAMFYLNALPMFFLGDSVVGIRLMTVIISCLALLSWWFFAARLGYRGLLIALLFAAISPSLVYYSNYVSQHAYLVFFLFAGLLLAFKFSETRNPTWLYALAPLIALLMTSHALGIFYIGLAALHTIVAWFVGGVGEVKERVRDKSFRLHIVAVALLTILCVVAVGSSFFTSFSNLDAWLVQLGYQSGKAFNTGHNKEVLYYLKIFGPLEMFAFAGTALSPFLLRRNFFNLFVMLVTFTSIIMLSVLPYKVPWLFVLALTQMYFLSGLALEALLVKLEVERDAAWMVYGVLLLLFVHLLTRSVHVNYLYPMAYQRENPLNYVGPVVDTQRIYDDLDTYLADNSPRRILVVLNTHWPLPYYLQGRTIHYLAEPEGEVDFEYYMRDFDVFIVHNDLLEASPPGLEDLGDTYEMRENHFVRVLVKSNEQFR
jgi:uncharacterized protein (TIGR03663 family)